MVHIMVSLISGERIDYWNNGNKSTFYLNKELRLFTQKNKLRLNTECVKENNLEDFLATQDCEVMVPGLMSFALFKVDNRLEDIKLL